MSKVTYRIGNLILSVGNFEKSEARNILKLPTVLNFSLIL